MDFCIHFDFLKILFILMIELLLLLFRFWLILKISPLGESLRSHSSLDPLNISSISVIHLFPQSSKGKPGAKTGLFNVNGWPGCA